MDKLILPWGTYQICKLLIWC